VTTWPRTFGETTGTGLAQIRPQQPGWSVSRSRLAVEFEFCEEDLVETATALTTGWSYVAGRPPRVLVVDDDVGVRLLCTATLRREGYEAIEAADGQEGFDRAITETPDLALVEVQMPELDGFGLAAAFLADERTRQLPLVFLAWAPDPYLEALAYETGALGFFVKPFDPGIVGLFVSRALADLAPKAETRMTGFKPLGDRPDTFLGGTQARGEQPLSASPA
jgi:two-component system chemotaxis response regulator CheY